MYSFLHKIKKTLFKIRAFALFGFIIQDYFVFKSKDVKKRFTLNISDAYPCLFEKTPFTKFDTHYIYHTAWAARKVQEINAVVHTDISSSLYFSSIVSAFKKVDFYDFRPAQLNLSNLESKSANLLHLDFPSNSIESLSCMHTVEHVGLGRYGDDIDPDGDLIAVKELSRVVKNNGSLLFVVPIGKPRIQYNAHRIYSYDMITAMFPDFEIKEFSLIPDSALDTGMMYHASKEDADKQIYGCGCFWFIKK